MRIKPQLEHPAQAIASAFLRAIADDDAAAVFERLSPQARGFLEGLHAARGGAAGELGDVVAPVRRSALAVLGGAERIGRFGVSGARVVDRHTAYVLLIPDVEKEGLVAETDWRPAYLLAFVYEGRDWLVDLGQTALLSADAGLPDPLGGVR